VNVNAEAVYPEINTDGTLFLCKRATANGAGGPVWAVRESRF